MTQVDEARAGPPAGKPISSGPPLAKPAATSYPLDVRSITVRYAADRLAPPTLRDVSLRIESASITALVGPNGAGKTTLLKAICDRLPVAAGEIDLAGARWRDPQARRCLGVAPQRPALLDRLTAFENVVFFARQWGMKTPDARKAARQALSLMQLEAFADLRAGRLSGGVRQRINIASAMVHRPALVILDEPGAALDPQANECIAEVCLSLRAEGFAILLTTHDLAQADQIADQIAIMSGGRLIQTASPATLKEEWSPGGLAVRIEMRTADGTLLEGSGYREHGPGVWRGRAASHAEIAELAAKLTTSGAEVVLIEAHAPTLADAIAARLAAEPSDQPRP